MNVGSLINMNETVERKYILGKMHCVLSVLKMGRIP